MMMHSKDMYSGHRRKWQAISGYPYEIAESYYDIQAQPIFPTDPGYSNDNVILTRQIDNKNEITSFTNLSPHTLPDFLVNMLNKGPRFCFPPHLDKSFFFDLKVNIYGGNFGLRWNFFLKDTPNNNIKIRFSRRRIVYSDLCKLIKRKVSYKFLGIKNLVVLKSDILSPRGIK